MGPPVAGHPILCDSYDPAMIATRRSPAAMLATALCGLAVVCPGPASAQQSPPHSATMASHGGAGGGAGATPAPLRALPFAAGQLEYPRVLAAYREKAGRVASLLASRGVTDLAEVYFRVFKREHALEVWGRQRGEQRFRLVREYPVCAVSGELGAKRRQGDRQVPEGFYTIDLLNPWSQYHLSMRVSYPSPVDRARGYRPALGGDIFIHGGCSTVGCVPVTDAYVEELYLVTVAAGESGQGKIPVHIYPTRMDDAGFRWLRERYGEDHPDYRFWRNLAEGYRIFERTRAVPVVGHAGRRYTVEDPTVNSMVSRIVNPAVNPLPDRVVPES